jgi:hypothetical protein
MDEEAWVSFVMAAPGSRPQDRQGASASTQASIRSDRRMDIARLLPERLCQKPRSVADAMLRRRRRDPHVAYTPA